MNPHQFLDAIMAFCHFTNASVTSYGRSRKHNEDVGGKVFSPHQFWLGCDVVYDDLPVPSAVAHETAERLGLFLISEGDHDHLQPLDWKAG